MSKTDHEYKWTHNLETGEVGVQHAKDAGPFITYYRGEGGSSFTTLVDLVIFMNDPKSIKQLIEIIGDQAGVEFTTDEFITAERLADLVKLKG